MFSRMLCIISFISNYFIYPFIDYLIASALPTLASFLPAWRVIRQLLLSRATNASFLPRGVSSSKRLFFEKQRNQVCLTIRNRTNHFFPLERDRSTKTKVNKNHTRLLKEKHLMVWPQFFHPTPCLLALPPGGLEISIRLEKPVKLFQFHQCEFLHR